MVVDACFHVLSYYVLSYCVELMWCFELYVSFVSFASTFWGNATTPQNSTLNAWKCSVPTVHFFKSWPCPMQHTTFIRISQQSAWRIKASMSGRSSSMNKSTSLQEGTISFALDASSENMETADTSSTQGNIRTVVGDGLPVNDSDLLLRQQQHMERIQKRRARRNKTKKKKAADDNVNAHDADGNISSSAKGNKTTEAGLLRF